METPKSDVHLSADEQKFKLFVAQLYNSFFGRVNISIELFVQ